MSAEVALRSPQDTKNDAEAEPSTGDLPTQSEHVETACCASDEQSLDMTVPECKHTVETSNPQSVFEPQTAETGVGHKGTNSMEVIVNVLDLKSNDDSGAEATTTPDKPGVSKPQEKSEIESGISGDCYTLFFFFWNLCFCLLAASSVSLSLLAFWLLFFIFILTRLLSSAGDALEAPEGVSASSLSGGQHISGVPQGGRDHHDSDKKNSDTHVASRYVMLSVSEKEKVESQILAVKDIGVSGAEEHIAKDGTHVPDQKEIDGSKAEKISTLQVACLSSQDITLPLYILQTFTIISSSFLTFQSCGFGMYSQFVDNLLDFAILSCKITTR